MLMASPSPINNTNKGVINERVTNERGTNEGVTNEEVNKPSKSANADYNVGAGVEGEGVTGFTKELTWQDIYNNEAKKVDQDSIDEWRTSLNNLLVFAAIFAAVLTAFIIESKKMLQQDAMDVVVEVLIFYTNNRANDSRPTFDKPDFRPSTTAVSINCLLFASLCASLVAALASVVALQWVTNYDAAIAKSRESPLYRTSHRQFRFAGMKRWKMARIIDGLPLLIFIGVLLFFAGLIQWMLEVNRVVGNVVAGGAIIAAFFYFSSTMVAVVYVAAPFRTPPIRWAYSSFRVALQLLRWILQALFPSHIIPEWMSKRAIDGGRSSGRDDRFITANESELQRDAYLWVSRHINISQDSYRRWILLMAEIPRWNAEQLKSELRDGPWMANLAEIARHYYFNLRTAHHTDEDAKCVSVLVRSYGVKDIHDRMEPKAFPREPDKSKAEFPYEADKSTAEYWNQYSLTTAGLIREPPMTTDPEDVSREPPAILDPSVIRRKQPVIPDPLLLLARDLPIPRLGSADEMKATIQLSKWRNSLDKEPAILRDILHRADMYSTEFLTGVLDVLYQYLPHSEWRFRDVNKRPIYISLMTDLINQEESRKLPLEETETISRVFAYLVSGETSYERPMRYGREILALLQNPEVRDLHVSTTFMLARTLERLPKNASLQRFREVIAMLWLVPHPTLERDLNTGPLKTKTTLNWSLSELYDNGCFRNWPERLESFPCALEILDRVLQAQAICGPEATMWPKDAEAEDTDVELTITIFMIFDNLLKTGSTSAQHYAVIESLCQLFEAEGSKSDRGAICSDDLQLLSTLHDPCIQFMACRVLGVPCLAEGTILDQHQESLERTHSFLVRDFAFSPPTVSVELSASFWKRCSPEQQKIWCRKAQNDPSKIKHIGSAYGDATLHRYQCSILSSLWSELVESGLDAAKEAALRVDSLSGPDWGLNGSSLVLAAGDTKSQQDPDWVTTSDNRVIFEGVRLQGRVLGLIARLLYKPEDRGSLQFSSNVTTEYIEHAWALSDAVRSRPTLMLDLLVPLFRRILLAERLELEGAIILKLFQEGLASHDDLSESLLDPMVGALQEAINSDFWNWVPGLHAATLEREATSTIKSIPVRTVADQETRIKGARLAPEGL